MKKTDIFPKNLELTVFGFPEILRRKKCLNWVEAEYKTGDNQVVVVKAIFVGDGKFEYSLA